MRLLQPHISASLGPCTLQRLVVVEIYEIRRWGKHVDRPGKRKRKCSAVIVHTGTWLQVQAKIMLRVQLKRGLRVKFGFWGE